MIGHVTLGTNDFGRATDFYDRLLAGVGAKRLETTETSCFFTYEDGGPPTNP